MNIRLIAFDLDGTLLNSEKSISAQTRAALERAADSGAFLVPATGRLHMGIPGEVLSLPSVRYVIAVNGAAVCDMEMNQILYRAELDRQEALDLMDYMDALPAIYGWYQNGQGFIPSRFYDKMEAYAHAPWLLESMKSCYLPTDTPKETLFEQEGGPQKLQLYFRDPEARLKALADMEKRFPQYAISSSLPINIEISAPDATKGQALSFLTSYLKLKREDTIAFGDGTNDISMICQAGLGVAMGNSAPEVLEAADEITDTNDQDGIAKVLMTFGYETGISV